MPRSRQFVEKLPSKYRVSLVTFATAGHGASAAHLRPRDADPEPADEDGCCRDGDRRCGLPRARRGEEGRRRGQERSRRILRRRSCSSPTERRPPASSPQPQAAQAARKAGIAVSTVSLGTAHGTVTQPLVVNGKTYPEVQPAPADPTTLQALARATGGRFFEAASASQLNVIYKDLGSRLVHDKEVREITVGVTAARARGHPDRRAALRALVQEARVTALRLAFSSRSPPRPRCCSPAPAVPANACSGIPKCISVAGPLGGRSRNGRGDVPARLPATEGRGRRDRRRRDARPTFAPPSTAILGSPVAFGRTTTRYALFRAVSVAHKPGAFRPYIGCIPTSAPAASTTAARVDADRGAARPQSDHVPDRGGNGEDGTFSCGANERLVDSWSSATFATDSPPAAAYGGMIQVTRVMRGNRVSITVRTSPALPGGAEAKVQLGVRCAVR